jgi:hypothetical protein
MVEEKERRRKKEMSSLNIWTQISWNLGSWCGGGHFHFFSSALYLISLYLS